VAHFRSGRRDGRDVTGRVATRRPAPATREVAPAGAMESPKPVSWAVPVVSLALSLTQICEDTLENTVGGQAKVYPGEKTTPAGRGSVELCGFHGYRRSRQAHPKHECQRGTHECCPCVPHNDGHENTFD
jgi:hypothetical protein